MSEGSLRELDFAALCNRRFFPSPAAWEDLVLHFLMLDRFSNGSEKGFRDNDGNEVQGGRPRCFSPPTMATRSARNSELVQKDSHVWFRNKVATVFDDHDQVRKGNNKARFCAGDESSKKLVLNVLALNATTLGIPCIYYGTEQRFDGAGGNDRYIREAMFGGDFGAFR